MTGIVIGTNDFRAGLSTVAVHALSSEGLPLLQRIRIDAGAENATITATDRFSVGMSIVSITMHTHAEIEPIDITPDDAAKILHLFKGGKEKRDEPEYLLRIESDDTHVTVTDCSGLIDGRVLKLPRLPVDEAFPDIPLMISRHHHARLSWNDEMIVNGQVMARFKVAAAAYDEPLSIESHEGHQSLLVRCGDSFLGVLMSFAPHADRLAELKEWHEGWTMRLPNPHAVASNASITLDRPADPYKPKKASDDDTGPERVDETVTAELLDRAADLITTSQFATSSMLQRKLRIGYARANAVLDRLEELGVVGPKKGEGPNNATASRDVLMTEAGWKERNQ
ncbi:MAG: DNA translocase FtsK [Rhodococcus sp. (in: high G+C Gram-positive bacteria)]